ncbi:uncharacterized protein B0H18DRAFT_879914 [Fomitopsis serialis]|uniref:uncharacterized protein n=1 Tax=Fomitopsis serialis TaxID=139415 RepID=UPI002007358E|nr:uncharacterized protein B0H18DRAFT_881862 [Neoantrodia serialis]XP_047891009.1 uncharacterized protein B0H18DRAFT_879914 [Neoantrodia serialis]KAH9919569.1 hypothetical protein B0H18DRAFT_881862 [Neoantrodia serialis]KAH9921822.1 hypothetical protein B0H18DRAFT_879914 [Neoantrodia serialis]
MKSRPPTYPEICAVSREAVSIYTRHGYSCCLFGSTACALYGTTRTPNDVDLVVFVDELDTERLKRLLPQANSSFYLVDAKDPAATYKVLWYKLPRIRGEAERRCKVDILIPGLVTTLNIPPVPPAYIESRDGIPVLPILPLLLLKLQGWDDHRNHTEGYMRAKQGSDVKDIRELLDIARRVGAELRNENVQWLPYEHIRKAQDRLFEYTRRFPKTGPFWESMGFACYTALQGS